MYWRHIVEFVVCLMIGYSTISLVYELIKMKRNERKKRRIRTEHTAQED